VRFSDLFKASYNEKYKNITSKSRQAPKKSAREILTCLLRAAKDVLHLSSKPKPSRKRTKKQPKTPRMHRAHNRVDGTTKRPRPTRSPKDGYHVASASQLNGCLVENNIRRELQTTPIKSSRPQSLKHRRPNTPHSSHGILLHSNSAAVLTDDAQSEETEDNSETPSPLLCHSPDNLSTIIEQTETESVIRPMSEVLSIGEARVGYLVSVSDYETSITRFAAKAIRLAEELGPSIEIYGRQEMELWHDEAHNPYSPEYFQPHLTKLFTRCCLCDINIQGDPIKLASSTFELGSAGLEIGACRYLNLPSHSGHSTVLRTEFDIITRQTKLVVHYCTPLCNEETLKKQYTLVSQIDVTDALRRLALQELNQKSASPSSSGNSSYNAVSSQMRRFLSFIYWLGAYHSNAICFTKQTSSTEPTADWQLRFASRHLREDPDFVPSAANTIQDFDHMARAMDQDDPFVQAMVWGAAANTTYLQYCVPVMDGRVGGEKWWVSWLVDKKVPGFWGKKKWGGEDMLEYPFHV
jgi:hypothetical protein